MTATLKKSSQLQKLSRNDVQLLWYSDFWDGPINGLCLCDNRKCWFEMLDAEEHDLPAAPGRRFLVHDLSEQQLAEEERWHELFREKVGTHCDFEEPRPEVKPAELHAQFYDAYKTRVKPDYSTNRVIGWFELI
jgi:hypothetical protein